MKLCEISGGVTDVYEQRDLYLEGGLQEGMGAFYNWQSFALTAQSAISNSVISVSNPLITFFRVFFRSSCWRTV